MSNALERFVAAISTRPGIAALLLIATLWLFLPGQASIPPLDRDEPRFAQATRQMLETGDFVQIRFQDAARNLQPAGIYWLQAASVSVFGDADRSEIWPHRIPSWVAAILVTFLTWWVGALLFGAPAGRIAGALIGSSVLLGVEAHIAKIDAVLCLTTLLAQASLAKIYMSRNEEARVGWWAALFWGALGFGILLKGPIIVLVTGGTVLALIVLERRARWLARLKPIWGVPLMLLIAAPWYVAIGLATNGEFYRTAIGYSFVGKVTQTHQAHGGPPGYHLALWPLMFWPGSLFAVLAAPFIWRERKSEAVRFCLAWIVPAWLMFELSGTKLPHYTLPLLPAVAVLAAAALVAAGRARYLGRPWLLAAAAPIWLVCGVVIAAAAIVLQARYQTSVQPLAIVLAAASVAGMLGVLALIIVGRARSALVAAVATATVLAFNNYQIIVPHLDPLFMSPRIAAALDSARPCPSTEVVSFYYREPSLVFLLDGHISYPGTAEGAAARVAENPQCSLVLMGERDAEFRNALARRGIAIEPFATVRGYNYNEGEASLVTLYNASAVSGTGTAVHSAETSDALR